jgi:hypothetical protein
MTTKSLIIELLATDKRAVARALVVLNKRQTADEQASQHTRYQNGRGFRPCHAKMGTSMATFFLKFGYLSDRQIAYWRVPMKDGKTRIEIYAGQLAEAAQIKASEAMRRLELADKHAFAAQEQAQEAAAFLSKMRERA